MTTELGANEDKKEYGGEWRIRTTEGVSQQIYSLPRLTAPETPHNPFPSAKDYSPDRCESSYFVALKIDKRWHSGYHCRTSANKAKRTKGARP